MTEADLLVDAFGRIQRNVERVVDGLSLEQLAVRVDPEANSIAWLIWHLTRTQDDHVADAADLEQVWTSEGWMERFNLPFESHVTGNRQTSADVAAVVVSSDLLVGYHNSVFGRTRDWATGLSAADLGRIVDVSYTPPVTLAVRLVSVINDNLQHAGQAAFVRGIVERS